VLSGDGLFGALNKPDLLPPTGPDDLGWLRNQAIATTTPELPLGQAARTPLGVAGGFFPQEPRNELEGIEQAFYNDAYPLTSLDDLGWMRSQAIATTTPELPLGQAARTPLGVAGGFFPQEPRNELEGIEQAFYSSAHLPFGSVESMQFQPMIASRQEPQDATQLVSQTALNECHQTSLQPRLSCDWPGNSCKTTFKGTYELGRHKRTKHEKNQPYFCPVLGCSRQTSKPYYRTDKLNDHINSIHSSKATDDFFACPVDQCPIYLPRDLLGLHLSKHVRPQGRISKASQSMLPWLHEIREFERQDRRRRSCPSQRCNKVLSDPASLVDHLARHSQETRHQEQDRVRKAGYDALTLEVLCPLCGTRKKSHEEMIWHIEQVHIVADRRHFEAWFDYFKQRGGMYPSSGMYSCGEWWIKVAEDTHLECPACDFQIDVQANRYTRDPHHHDFITPSIELFEQRRAILQIWPEFEEHQVFADLSPELEIERAFS
jgi:hypothetical protein